MRFNLTIWLYQGGKWELNTEARRDAYLKKEETASAKDKKIQGRF